MEYKENFNHYTNDYSKLVGRYVLYESGQTYNKNNNKYICKIIKVTKTGFRISKANYEKTLFAFDGYEKGLHSKIDWSTYSKCTLLTDEEAHKISEEWTENKIKKQLIEDIKNALKIELSLDTIQEIHNILIEK